MQRQSALFFFIWQNAARNYCLQFHFILPAVRPVPCQRQDDLAIRCSWRQLVEFVDRALRHLLYAWCEDGNFDPLRRHRRAAAAGQHQYKHPFHRTPSSSSLTAGIASSQVLARAPAICARAASYFLPLVAAAACAAAPRSCAARVALAMPSMARFCSVIELRSCALTPCSCTSAARAASRSPAASHQPVPVELATTSSTAASAIAAAFQMPLTAAPASVPRALIRYLPRS